MFEPPYSVIELPYSQIGGGGFIKCWRPNDLKSAEMLVDATVMKAREERAICVRQMPEDMARFEMYLGLEQPNPRFRNDIATILLSTAIFEAVSLEYQAIRKWQIIVEQSGSALAKARAVLSSLRELPENLRVKEDAVKTAVFTFEYICERYRKLIPERSREYGLARLSLKTGPGSGRPPLDGFSVLVTLLIEAAETATGKRPTSHGAFPALVREVCSLVPEIRRPNSKAALQRFVERRLAEVTRGAKGLPKAASTR
jgi:hypothetical protein